MHLQPKNSVRESVQIESGYVGRFRSVMKTEAPTGRGWRLALVMLAIATGISGTAALRAEDRAQPAQGAGVPNSDVRREAISLIRLDAVKKNPSNPTVIKESELPTTDGTVVLDRFDVQGNREIPDFTPPRENRVEEFFRTGTFKEHVGKKVTTRLWASGYAGLVLTFSW